MLRLLAKTALVASACFSGGCGYLSGSAPSNPLSMKHMVRDGERVRVKFVEAPLPQPGTVQPFLDPIFTPVAVAAITGLVNVGIDQAQKYAEWEVSLHTATYTASDTASQFYTPSGDPKATGEKWLPRYDKISLKRDVPDDGPDKQGKRVAALRAEFSLTPVSANASSLMVKLDKLDYDLAAAKLSGRVEKQPVTIELKLEFASAWTDKEGKWHDEILHSKPIVFTVPNVKVGRVIEPEDMPSVIYFIPAPPLSISGETRTNANLRVTATVTETDQSKLPEIRKQLAAQLKELKEPVTNLMVNLAGLSTEEKMADEKEKVGTPNTGTPNTGGPATGTSRTGTGGT